MGFCHAESGREIGKNLTFFSSENRIALLEFKIMMKEGLAMKKFTKRALGIVLAVSMALTMSACGSKETAQDSGVNQRFPKHSIAPSIIPTYSYSISSFPLTKKIFCFLMHTKIKFI